MLDLQAKFLSRRAQTTQKKMNWPLFRHAIQERRETMEDPDPAAQYRGIREVFAEARAVATERIPRAERLSANTRVLFDQRRALLAKDDALSRIQLVQTNKLLRSAIASDIEKNLLTRYRQTLASKRLFEDISTPAIGQLQRKDGSRTVSSQDVRDRVKEFFDELYQQTVNVVPSVKPPLEEVQPVRKKCGSSCAG